MIVLVAIVSSLTLVLTVLSSLLIIKRIKRTQARLNDNTKRWAIQALSSIETRLRYQSELARPGKIDFVILTTRDRAQLFDATVRSIKKHEPNAKIVVVDVGSNDDTARVINGLFVEGHIHLSIRHQVDTVPQWQKGYAIHEAWRLCALMDPLSITVIDDDMLVTQPFISKCVHLCAADSRVKVVALHRDQLQERNHPSTDQMRFDDQTFMLGKTFNGAAFYMPFETLRQWGPPPVDEGINDYGVEDWYYSRALHEPDSFAAFLSCVSEQANVVSLREAEE